MNKSPWRISLLAVLPLWIATTSGAPGFKAALEKAGKSINTELHSIKNPVDHFFNYIGYGHCSNIKKLAGVLYAPIAGKVEPDLNGLKLHYVSPSVNISFDLNSAAETVPGSRNYDTNNNLILYMDGFTESAKGYNFWAISDAFLKRGEFNILGLDASSLASWFYLQSTAYVKFIGKRLGEVLAAMVNKGQQPKSIHLIGHSVGAHIAGFAGKTFHNLTGYKVGRITGLDPAGRCFADMSSELRLKETDAEFVDVIHTDNGVYGLGDRIGHVDFYPNGGSHQPGCLSQTCCHLRAVQFFAESIGKPDAFIGRQCEDYDQFRNGTCSDDTSIMGYECPTTSHGKYYLQTADTEPFGVYEGGLHFVNNEGVVRNVQHTISSAVKGFISKIGGVFRTE